MRTQAAQIEAARCQCACHMALLQELHHNLKRHMQVLAIVYGGNSTQPGAFYPKGLNGNINGTIATS